MEPWFLQKSQIGLILSFYLITAQVVSFGQPSHSPFESIKYPFGLENPVLGTIHMEQRISTEDGLSSDVPTCFLKDRQGFVWIGTAWGLNRYDGYEFKTYFHKEQDSFSLSDDYILCMLEDSFGMIWIGTMNGGLNRFDPASETFSHFPPESGDQFGIRNSQVFSICEDGKGDIWFAAHLPNLQSIYKISPVTGLISCIVNDSLHPEQAMQIHSHDMIRDSKGNMWVGCEKGILKYDRIQETFEEFLIDAYNDNTYCQVGIAVHEDRNGKIWIGSYGGGLYLLNQKTGTLARINLEPDSPPGREANFISAITEDDHGNLILRTEMGIDFLNTNTGEFARLPIPELEYLSQKAIYWDACGLLWFSAAKAEKVPFGVSKVQLRKQGFAHLSPKQLNIVDPATTWISAIFQDQNGGVFLGGSSMGLIRKPAAAFQIPAIEDISAVYQDSNGRLWVGNWKNGDLYMLDTSGFEIFGIPDYHKIFSFKNRPYVPGYQFIRYDDFVFSGAGSMRIHELTNGRLLIARGTGLDLFDPGSGKFQTIDLFPDSVAYHDLPVISSLAEDRSGNIWIGTMHLGLFKLTPPFVPISSGSVQTQKIESFRFDKDTPKYLGNLKITSLCVPEHNDDVEIWIGTLGGGLFGYKPDQYVCLTTDDGLAHDAVYGILEDGQGDLWLSTERGLSRYRSNTGEFRNYTETDGVPVKRFHWLSNHKGSDGRMYFGGSNGIISFHPDSIKDNNHIPPVVITGFRIFDKAVPVNKDSPLEKPISQTHKLELSHRENYISFEFASLDFVAPDKNRFRYMLEGIDRDWIDADFTRNASYSNLRHGRYTFQVIGSNNDGIWNETGTSLKVRIHPPPWLSWWAYCIYTALLFGLILWYWNYQQSRAKLRISHELDKMKSNLYSNITHEFRTPLTLLLGPINDMLKEGWEGKKSDRLLLQFMKRNAERLKQLVDQLLDISKLETGKIKLRVSEGNLSSYTRTIASSFVSFADSKNIKYELDLSETDTSVYFDRDKIEKILSNLISNSLKFTYSDGYIIVSLSYKEDSAPGHGYFCVLKVHDTGKGIPADQHKKIFDHFYQVGSGNSKAVEGTGIGLAFVKELVELYRGSIIVKSEPDVGSTFIVTLPVSADLFNEDEIVASEGEYVEQAAIFDQRVEGVLIDNLKAQSEDEKSVDEKIVLIVEDNTDLRSYIAGTLGDIFHIIEAGNGSDGLTLAFKHIPDLVITDLMMPGMDGLDMCDLLRADQRTSHIPLIMLTARADRGSKIDGLGKGVDDYILKPFDAEELMIRVKNLIEQRKRLKEKFRKDFLAESLDTETAVLRDPFIEKLLTCIHSRMTNDDFGVEELGKEIGLSRTQLYRKSMAIINSSPSEMLRNERLKMAARLFREGHRNVSEVMYSVGLNSPSNFATHFRNMFGKNPAEYIRQHTTPGS